MSAALASFVVAEEVPAEPPACYLDVLPTEVVDHVFRFFSRLPAIVPWENHIPLQDVVELYRVGGAFTRLFRNRFQTLCISRTIDCADENRAFKWKHRVERMLWTNNMEVAHEFILAGGGESIHTLIVGRDMYDETHNGTEVVDTFRAYCPNLAALSVQEKGCVWTERFGNIISALEIWSPSSLSVSQHCTGLRELTASFSRNGVAAANLWERVGCTLESLTIGNFGITAEEIPWQIGRIGRYCRNIRRISIQDVSEEGNTAISQLLASYGEQLQYAKIHYMNEAQWGRVLRVCTNARFHVIAMGTHSLLPTVNIVGRQLEKVLVASRTFVGDVADFTRAWDKCVNLRELYVQVGLLEHIRPVLSTPKPHLKSIILDVGQVREEGEMRELVDLLSSRTRGVERFSLACPPYRLFSWDSLGPFFELNKSTLSYVSLPFKYTDKEMGDTLEKLLSAPALKEISCMGYPDDNTLERLGNAGVQCRGFQGSIHYYEPPSFDWNLLV